MYEILEGRLELIYVFGRLAGCGLGYLKNKPEFPNQRTLVRGIRDFYKGEVIARFGRPQRNKCLFPVANFISEKRYFLGLSPQSLISQDYQSYIFCGVWDEKWTKSYDYPSIQEINEHFDPGNIGGLIYCRTKSNDSEGRLIISNQGIFPIKGDFSYIMNRNLRVNERKNSRVIIIEDQDDFFSVLKHAQKQKLSVVRMQPLDEITAIHQYL